MEFSESNKKGIKLKNKNAPIAPIKLRQKKIISPVNFIWIRFKWLEILGVEIQKIIKTL